MESVHDFAELKQMQSLSLKSKISMTKRRIRAWFDYFDGQVYLSFSGGKDSTVLKHLIDDMYGQEVPSVFVNTGLEYPEIQSFVKKQKSTIIIRPEMRFDDVLKKYGYPVISKEVSECVEDAKRNIPKGKITTRVKKLTGGYEGTRKDGKRSRYDLRKYEFLINAPFDISSKCCNVMKKSPLKSYEKQSGRKPYIATLADDSQLRRTYWMRYGCNIFDGTHPRSRPMSFWTEQDVLQYIAENDIEIASIYGKIEQDENGKYRTTGEDRTGCIFCMFGCHLEQHPNRFERLKESHPNQYNFCIGGGEYVEGKLKPNKEGLGIGKVLDFLGIDY